jgi:hypothetical protein
MQAYVAVLPTDTSSLCSSPSTYLPSSVGPLTKSSKAIDSFDEILGNLRKSSLHLLGSLKEMRTRFKLPTPSPENNDEEKAREYDPFITLSDLPSETVLVRSWVECVDAILLSSRREKEMVDAVFKKGVSRRVSKGHKRSSRVVSVEEVIGEDLEVDVLSTERDVEGSSPSLEIESRVDLGTFILCRGIEKDTDESTRSSLRAHQLHPLLSPALPPSLSLTILKTRIALSPIVRPLLPSVSPTNLQTGYSATEPSSVVPTMHSSVPPPVHSGSYLAQASTNCHSQLSCRMKPSEEEEEEEDWRERG